MVALCFSKDVLSRFLYKIKIFNNTQKVTKEEALKQNANVLCDNSLLLSIDGTIGNVAIYNNERIMLGKSACYINPSAKILRDFLLLAE